MFDRKSEFAQCSHCGNRNVERYDRIYDNSLDDALETSNTSQLSSAKHMKLIMLEVFGIGIILFSIFLMEPQILFYFIDIAFVPIGSIVLLSLLFMLLAYLISNPR